MKHKFTLLLLMGLSMAWGSQAQNVRIGNSETVYVDTDFDFSSVLKSGTAVYTSSDHTLTLTDAVIETQNVVGIRIFELSKSENSSLTIRLVGDNTVTSEEAEGIDIYDEYEGGKNPSVTFTGSGSLTVRSTGWAAMRVGSFSSENEYKVTFKDTNVKLQGKYGIQPATNGNGTQALVVEFLGSNVTLEGSSQENWRTFYSGALTNAKKITLTGCTITSPEGAYVGIGQDTDSGYGCAAILAAGGEHPEVGPVVITAGVGDISMPTVSTTAVGAAHDLYGRRVGPDYRGIVVRDGRKHLQ